MFVTDFAKFSGKGAPMVSRSGVQTISSYTCFKHPYSEEEKRKGLHDTMS